MRAAILSNEAARQQAAQTCSLLGWSCARWPPALEHSSAKLHCGSCGSRHATGQPTQDTGLSSVPKQGRGQGQEELHDAGAALASFGHLAVLGLGPQRGAAREQQVEERRQSRQQQDGHRHGGHGDHGRGDRLQCTGWCQSLAVASREQRKGAKQNTRGWKLPASKTAEGCAGARQLVLHRS